MDKLYYACEKCQGNLFRVATLERVEATYDADSGEWSDEERTDVEKVVEAFCLDCTTPVPVEVAKGWL